MVYLKNNNEEQDIWIPVDEFKTEIIKEEGDNKDE